MPFSGTIDEEGVVRSEKVVGRNGDNYNFAFAHSFDLVSTFCDFDCEAVHRSL